MIDRLPTLRVREMIRILETCGFFKKRQTGSHAHYYHPDGRRVTVPIHPGDLSRKLVLRILKQAGISDQEW